MANRRMGFSVSLWLCLVAIVTCLPPQDGHCYPGNACFPSQQKITDLDESLTGSLILPGSDEYNKLIVMKDTVWTRRPAVIAAVANARDVQKCLKFTAQYNLKVTVQSSGHDYIGRSTADGSFQIYLGKMIDINVDLSSASHPDGIITVESGNSWLRVYETVDTYNRTIVGGSAHTVSMGGYTLGGGHSPISRVNGLAVDNLLEVELVTADGTLVTANDEMTKMTDENGVETVGDNADLFWALRGGGGGTFGVVTKFTFKLHQPPPAFQRAYCVFGLYYNDVLVGIDIWRKFDALLTSDLAREWGGYVIMSGMPDPKSPVRGSISLFINHHGARGTPSFNTFQSFFDYAPTRKYCEYKEYATFLEYERTAVDPLYFNSYVTNILLQKDSFNDSLYTALLDELAPRTTGSVAGCTGALIGGKVSEVGDDVTPLNPGFRSAVMSLTCGITWADDDKFDLHWNEGEQMAKNLLQFGKGSYLNEASAYLPDWQTAYWGDHYDKLLQVKQAWDPNNTFTCHHCVGYNDTTTTTRNPDDTTTSTPDDTTTSTPDDNTNKPIGSAQAMGWSAPLFIFILMFGLLW